MIRDVHHVGVAVGSLEQAFRLFHEALALPVVKQEAVPARGVRAALLAVGGACVELIEPNEETSPFARFIAERGEGLHHLALWSDDVEADVARLRDQGVPLLDHEPRRGFAGQVSYLAPAAFDGALLELVQPEPGLGVPAAAKGTVRRVDHVVLRVPDVAAASEGFEAWFGVPTKRTLERGGTSFAFMRPGDAIIEVIGPKDGGGEPGTGRVAGLAFEVAGIDPLTESLRAKGYPVGEPHPALQGGRIASVHHGGACGVPLAFIDFTDAPPLP